MANPRVLNETVLSQLEAECAIGGILSRQESANLFHSVRVARAALLELLSCLEFCHVCDGPDRLTVDPIEAIEHRSECSVAIALGHES